MKRALATLTLVLLTSGCHKAKTDADAQLQKVSDAFAKADLKTESFAPGDAAAFHAEKCMTGKIEGVDSVVCEYGSLDALALGKKAGEAWAAGAPTAAVLGNGRVLLAVADRAHVDPNGKAIHKITHAFTHLQ
ncbi:MAG TPA: hypothetical protein VHB97_03845 [Polyangia bacterium]|nr:hypothetical protein [Polyangia bacterium]